MTNKVKQCWRGMFNFNRELYILYCHAFSIAQAREVFFRRLADKQGVNVYTVRNYFNDETPNYEITLEMEVREDD
jgi:hypothetical protein